MGNRALIQFKKESKFSPVLYLHWTDARKVIELTKKTMAGRNGDLDYTFARAVFHACSLCGGADENLSVGVWNETRKLIESHGDQGAFIVDVVTWKIENFK